MREIKFRAWYCREKCWHYFTLTDLIIGRASGESLQYENWCEYTGLKDRNNKEIYEGDKLSDDGVFIDGDVRWNQEDVCYNLVPGGDISSDWKYMEVVGNIYEDGDLLDGK